MNPPVHFIDIGGGKPWPWQNVRALETARVHDAPIIIWTNRMPGETPPMLGYEFRELHVPRWLLNHPIRLANVKDYYAYRILRAHGGIYLDFDTISLRPAWDLLTADVCMSTEFPEDQPAGAPYNTAVILAVYGAPILLHLEMEALTMLRDGEDTWGAIGPHLISKIARQKPEEFSPAPYRALNGWSYHQIDDYYDNPRDPGEDCRVIHLYSSDNMEKYLGDKWSPL